MTDLKLTDAQKMMVLLTGNLPTTNYNGPLNSMKGGVFCRYSNDLDKGSQKIVDAEVKSQFQHKHGRRTRREKTTYDGIKRQEKVRNRLRKKLGKPKLT